MVGGRRIARTLASVGGDQLIVTAKDDPIIPVEVIEPFLGLNHSLHFLISERGGHWGWIERREGRLTSWLPRITRDFLEAAVGA